MDFFDYSKISSAAQIARSTQEIKECLNGLFGVGSTREIEKVIFNDPATIVLWGDGSKTVVKTQGNDVYDPEKGLAMCFAKKYLGNYGNYYEMFKAWLPEETEETSNVSRDLIVEYFKNGGTWIYPDWLNINPPVWKVRVTFLYNHNDRFYTHYVNLNIRAKRHEELSRRFNEYCRAWNMTDHVDKVIGVEILDVAKSFLEFVKHDISCNKNDKGEIIMGNPINAYLDARKSTSNISEIWG